MAKNNRPRRGTKAERAAVVAISQRAQQAATAGLKTLTDRVPVRTGRMKRGCYLRRSAGLHEIQSSVEYRRYVEGYYTAIQSARRAVRAELEKPLDVRVKVRGKEKTVSLARTKCFRLQGGLLKVALRRAREVRFALRANGRVAYTTRIG